MVITQLDRMVSIIKGTEDKPYSSDPALGLSLMNDGNITYSGADNQPGVWVAWCRDDDTISHYATNALVAVCRCYITKQLEKIK